MDELARLQMEFLRTAIARYGLAPGDECDLTLTFTVGTQGPKDVKMTRLNTTYVSTRATCRT